MAGTSLEVEGVLCLAYLLIILSRTVWLGIHGQKLYSESDSSVMPMDVVKSDDFGCLDDSEVIIDSDTSASVLVQNSFDGVASDVEIDSSPVHDTGSDSPNIATSSTSEKDTGSDSGSDT